MKYFIYIINCLLVILIPVTFMITPSYKPEVSSISTEVSVKQLNSSDFKEVTMVNDIILEEENTDDNTNVETEEYKPETTVSQVTEIGDVQKKEEQQQNPIDVVKTDVLDTYTGKMSGYGPDCKGCTGYLSNGRYVGDGNIYYNDSQYGKIRIVAGDKSLKFGTIVRVKNSKIGNFNAIVLDRGSSIGFGKTFMFDLLYPSEKEALKDEVSYNVTFEILRYGY